jgi:hypothetical protein
MALAFSLSVFVFIFVACGKKEARPPSAGGARLYLLSDAYYPVMGGARASCAAYLGEGLGDHDYWIDPAGNGNEFVVSCDMTGGGYTVFSSSSTPAFPHANLTDSVVTFFTDQEVSRINALRAIATEMRVESDLVIRYETDTAAGGCGGAPVIAQGTMEAVTLPLAPGTVTTETLREFYGSADQARIDFDNATNEFFVAALNPASPGCADAIVDRFGLGDPVWIKSMLLFTNGGDPTRAYSRVSGTYYRILLK